MNKTLIALTLTLLAGAAFIFMYDNKQPAPTVPPSRNELEQTIQTDQLKGTEYKFDELGLKFSTPDNLSVNLEEPNPGMFTLYIQNTEIGDNFFQMYGIWQTENKATVDDLQNVTSEMIPESIENLTVGGQPAIRGQYKGERNRFVTVIYKNESLFTILTSQPTKQNEELANKIMSTFEFYD